MSSVSLPVPGLKCLKKQKEEVQGQSNNQVRALPFMLSKKELGCGLKRLTLHTNSSINWMSQKHRTDALCCQAICSTGSHVNIRTMCVMTKKEQLATISTNLSTFMDRLLEINPPSPRKKRMSRPRQLRQTSLKRSIKNTHLAQLSSHRLMRLLLQFRGLLKKRPRSLSLLILLSLLEELL